MRSDGLCITLISIILWNSVSSEKYSNTSNHKPILLKAQSMTIKNKTPVLTAGQSFILGYTDEQFSNSDYL